MIDPWSPHKIVALPDERYAHFRQINPEISLNDYCHCSPLVICGPLGAFIACRVDAPLNFDIRGEPNVF